MSSTPISPEALAEFIHVNCSYQYGMKVIEKLQDTLIQRSITIDVTYKAIEELNGLQLKLNKVQIIMVILDTALTIGSIASIFSTTSAVCAGAVANGAHCLIRNGTCNAKVKPAREAMMEDKRYRDDLQTLLGQQDLPLPFEVTEFKTEAGAIHEIVAAISKYVTGNNIDWIKHLENIGILGITPVVPAEDTTATSDQSKCSLSDAFKTLTKAIKVLKGFAGKRFSKIFSALEKIITMLSNCLNAGSECHPTAGLLEAKYIPELMHDAVIMQELLDELVRNYKL